MISNITYAKSNVKRSNEIIGVLAKYGLAEWFGDGTPGFVRRRFVTTDGVRVKELPFNVRVRMALATSAAPEAGSRGGRASPSLKGPALISMPPSGNGGPEANYVGYGVAIEQLGGFVGRTGYAGDIPLKSGINYGDPVAGPDTQGFEYRGTA